MTQVAYSQTVMMRAKCVGGTNCDEQAISRINQELQSKILSDFTSYIKQQDKEFLNFLSKDTIAIDFLITELRIDVILVQVVSENMIFRKYPFTSNSFQDAKGLFLLERFKFHFASHIWEYPRELTLLNLENKYAVKYHLKNKKEVLFQYLDLAIGEYIPKLTLARVAYLNFESQNIVKKKKPEKITQRIFIDSDFVEVGEGFYKYQQNFMDYINNELQLTNW